jgi:hypothetical protein
MSKVVEMTDGIAATVGGVRLTIDRNLNFPACVNDPLVAVTADADFRIQNDILLNEDEFTDQLSVLSNLFNDFGEADVLLGPMDEGLRDILDNEVNFNDFVAHRLQVAATAQYGPAGKDFTLLLPIFTVGDFRSAAFCKKSSRFRFSTKNSDIIRGWTAEPLT